MPRPRRPIRLAELLPDGRHLIVDEGRDGRRPQARLWHPDIRRYRRMTLETPTLRDASGRPDFAAQAAAMAEARARLSEIEGSADAAPVTPPTLTPTVGSALCFALEPGVKARHSRSKQDSEWRRAAADVRAALPDDRFASAPVAADVRLVAASAMLRASARIEPDTWREHLNWARQQPAPTDGGPVATWEHHLHLAFRRATAPTAAPGTERAHPTETTTVESHDQVGAANSTQPRRARVPWAWRTVELMRAMMNVAASERPDVFGALADMKIPRDLTTRLQLIAQALGLQFDEEEFRPRYARDEVHRLLTLLSDPRFQVRSVLARTRRGLPGAYDVMRSHLQEADGDCIKLRYYVGGKKNPHQFTHAVLEVRQSALLRMHLRTTYARWEERFDASDPTTDYSLLRHHRWTGVELVPDPKGELPRKIDARFRLLLDVGVEQRYEQQLRLRRSDLSRVADTEHFLLPELGIADNKQSGIRIASERQRLALALEMEAGVLQELEDAYRRGDIADYPIFAGRGVAAGRITLTDGATPPEPLDDRTITSWCRKLEEALGIEHVEGRGMRGWRRAFIDLYDAWTDDDIVKTLITGHRQEEVQGHGATRRDVYLKKATTERLLRAARLIDYARTTWVRTQEPPPKSDEPASRESAEPSRRTRVAWKTP